MTTTKAQTAGRTSLAEVDGLTYRGNSARIPFEITEWLESGLVDIDLPNDCFRLTESGRAAAEATNG